MIKNTMAILATGMILFLAATAMMFFPIDPGKYHINSNMPVVAVTLTYAVSVIFLGLFSYLIGREARLNANELVPGKGYILIQHVSVENEIVFSVIRKTNSKKIRTINPDSNLSDMEEGQAFSRVDKVIVKIS